MKQMTQADLEVLNQNLEAMSDNWAYLVAEFKQIIGSFPKTCANLDRWNDGVLSGFVSLIWTLIFFLVRKILKVMFFCINFNQGFHTFLTLFFPLGNKIIDEEENNIDPKCVIQRCTCIQRKDHNRFRVSPKVNSNYYFKVLVSFWIWL